MSKLFNLLATIAVIVIAVLQFPAVTPHPSKGVVLGLSLAAVLFLIASYVFSVLENRRHRKKETERDKEQAERFAYMTNLLETNTETLKTMSSVVEKQQALLDRRPTSDSAPQSLAQRTRTLATDLLAYLKGKGPIPDYPPMRAGPTGGRESWNEKWRHFWEVKRPLEQQIDAGYSAHFAERTSKLRHEIQESNVNTWKLDEVVDKKYHDSETIRELAALLLEFAIRMETDELLKGGP